MAEHLLEGDTKIFGHFHVFEHALQLLGKTSSTLYKIVIIGNSNSKRNKLFVKAVFSLQNKQHIFAD